MVITVVGSVTRDTLIFPDQGWRVNNSLGGMLYTVGALAALTGECIKPVCNIGGDIFDEATAFLKKFPNVDLAGVQKVQRNNVHSYILFASEYGTQYDEGSEVPVRFSQIKPFLAESAFIVVNPVTGFEIQLKTLRKIKQFAKCPVYFDYHILALGRDPTGSRFLYKRPNWFAWCTSCDYLQLNQFEAELLGACSIASETDALLLTTPILDHGVRSVAITLGSRGVYVYRKEQQRVRSRWIKALRIPFVHDVTGCGDVFGAGFVAHYLQTRELVTSYEYANRAAGLKCRFGGLEGLAGISTLGV